MPEKNEKHLESVRPSEHNITDSPTRCVKCTHPQSHMKRGAFSSVLEQYLSFHDVSFPFPIPLQYRQNSQEDHAAEIGIYYQGK